MCLQLYHIAMLNTYKLYETFSQRYIKKIAMEAQMAAKIIFILLLIQ